jgi:hypothetical protein
MEIFYWKEWKRPERARARTGSKTGKQEAKQAGVMDGKTYNRQRSGGHIMLMQREVYLGRGRKGNIREQSRKRERTD